MSTPSAAAPPQERPADQLQASSLLGFVFPSDPQVSPDGGRVAFVLTRIEEDDPAKVDAEFAKPRYKSRIWLSDGGPARELTGGTSKDTAPRWSPDGTRLAFLSDRDDKPQLFLLPLAGGEGRQLTHFKAGAGEPKWSPDGRFIAFLSLGDHADKRPERGQARVITRLSYKMNGAGFLPDPRRTLYRLEVASGELIAWHTPEQEIGDIAWWPDARGVLFVSSVDEQAATRWENEVFDLPLGGDVRQLTRWASAVHSLAPHPDGVRFAALGRPTGSNNTEDTHLFLFGQGGEGRRIDASWDRPAGNIVASDCHVGAMPGRPVWQDAQTLTLPYTVGGACGLFDVGLDGQVQDRLHDPEGVVGAFTANAHGLAYLRESASVYPEVYLNNQRVSDCAAHLGDFPRRTPERVTFSNELGEGEGWVLLPEGENLPALLNIHGGPHTAYGHGFLHEFQLYAARGYAVCYGNPRGSVGYGQAWTADIFGRWGTVDMADLLAFFDTCLMQFPQLDTGRTGVMGGSYGGLMTNWITGHTGRFRVAVTDRSICNFLSFGGTSDIGMRFWDDELGGNFHRANDVQKLWDMSPLKYVEQVKTPTLIIHSEDDLRCPIEQAEQWFAALKLHGVETRFVRFPGEDHELSRSGRPDRRVVRLNEYLDWVDRHLKG